MAGAEWREGDINKICRSSASPFVPRRLLHNLQSNVFTLSTTSHPTSQHESMTYRQDPSRHDSMINRAASRLIPWRLFSTSDPTNTRSILSLDASMITSSPLPSRSKFQFNLSSARGRIRIFKWDFAFPFLPISGRHN